MHEMEDRATGVLLGLAAGDRFGGPVRMALEVAESLRDRGGFDRPDIAARYLRWWREGGFDTGATAARVLTLAAGGVSLDRAAFEANSEAGGMTAGCNPAHRSAPLAMCAAIEDSRLDAAARGEARLTHRNPLAGEVAGAVVCLCRALIRGEPWPAALEAAAAGRGPETRRALEGGPPGPLSRGGFAPEVLEAAVHFVQGAGSFRSALTRSLEFAGPANYCPVLVGSIGGARWGAVQVDEGLLQGHGDLVPRLRAAASALAEGWRSEA